MGKQIDATDKLVGQRVRLARTLANLSQTALGDAIGVTFQQVQKYENGTNRIGPGRLAKIAATTKRPVAWFYGDDAAPAARKGDADLVVQMLTAPGGMKLCTSYLAIENPKLRTAIVQIADAAAHPGEARKAA